MGNSNSSVLGATESDQYSRITKETSRRIAGWSESSTSIISPALNQGSEEYRQLETLIEPRLLYCAHSFRIESIEIGKHHNSRLREFDRRVALHSTPNVHLLFHGTAECNHESIFETGFDLDEHRQDKIDQGYIGKGVYFSPFPEYSAAYIKGTFGIRHLEYKSPVVNVGSSCILLGCLVYVGKTNRLYKKDYGSEIDSNLDSRWAWVQSNGEVSDVSDPMFAIEYVIRESVSIAPALRVTLKRVDKEVVWLDPNIANEENRGYVRELKQCNTIYLLATDSQSRALQTLKGKEGTQYRAITSGRGGEEFVRNLRKDHSSTTKVLVFCGNIDYHKKWARKFNVLVTRSDEVMKKFATWTD